MKIALQTAAASVAGLLFFGILLFGPAGTFDFWQAWVFIAVFTVSTGVPNIYLARRKPEVMQRRIHAGPTAENRPAQKIVTSAIFLTVVVLLVVSTLDHRSGWSSVPVPVVLMGSVLVAVGLVVAELVVFQNSYAAASITVERGQTLVSTGLYGVVRHPMYTGALIMMIGTPFALGSYWGLVVVLAALLALGFRIDDEEKMLRQELDGYDDFAHKRSVTAWCPESGDGGMSATRPAAPEALLVILQRMSPSERLAFVLHDMFDLPFAEIAPTVGRSANTAAQLAARARRRVRGKTPDPTSDLVHPRRLIAAFLTAARDGDFASLLDALHTDVVQRFGVVGDKITDIDIEATRTACMASGWPSLTDQRS